MRNRRHREVNRLPKAAQQWQILKQHPGLSKTLCHTSQREVPACPRRGRGAEDAEARREEGIGVAAPALGGGGSSEGRAPRGSGAAPGAGRPVARGLRLRPPPPESDRARAAESNLSAVILAPKSQLDLTSCLRFGVSREGSLLTKGLRVTVRYMCFPVPRPSMEPLPRSTTKLRVPSAFPHCILSINLWGRFIVPIF